VRLICLQYDDNLSRMRGQCENICPEKLCRTDDRGGLQDPSDDRHEGGHAAQGPGGLQQSTQVCKCLALCLDCMYGEYWFLLLCYVYDGNRFLRFLY
jgi:hypothetical protein